MNTPSSESLPPNHWIAQKRDSLGSAPQVGRLLVAGIQKCQRRSGSAHGAEGACGRTTQASTRKIWREKAGPALADCMGLHNHLLAEFE